MFLFLIIKSNSTFLPKPRFERLSYDSSRARWVFNFPYFLRPGGAAGCRLLTFQWLNYSGRDER